jgi:hypothetical protein
MVFGNFIIYYLGKVKKQKVGQNIPSMSSASTAVFPLVLLEVFDSLEDGTSSSVLRVLFCSSSAVDVCGLLTSEFI